MPDLTDKVFIITGGNGGIGLGMAEGIAKAGGSVAIWGRNETKNKQALKTLNQSEERVQSFICDVTDEKQVEEAFQATVDAFGKVDSCFANAGGAGERGLTHQIDMNNWRGVIDLNLNSVLMTFRAMTQHLLDRKAPGKLIATSSVAALMGTGYQASYSTTKAAVVGLVRSLAVELGQHGISANALLPGYVESDLTEKAPQAFKDAAQRRACLGRVGCLEDMEGVAVFLASKSSDYMTGHALVMDGGHTIHPL